MVCSVATLAILYIWFQALRSAPTSSALIDKIVLSFGCIYILVFIIGIGNVCQCTSRFRSLQVFGRICRYLRYVSLYFGFVYLFFAANAKLSCSNLLIFSSSNMLFSFMIWFFSVVLYTLLYTRWAETMRFDQITKTFRFASGIKLPPRL